TVRRKRAFPVDDSTSRRPCGNLLPSTDPPKGIDMLNTTPTSGLPVAVLGAGPVGLAAAANLLEREVPVMVLESGARVGAHLLDYGHVRLFSPWRYNIDPSMARLLSRAGWQAPPSESLPLAVEVVEKF